LLRLSSLSKKYGQQVILQELNLTLEAGSITVVQGPSGAGKSTLVHLILKVESCDAGRLFFKEQEYGDLSYKAMLPIKKEMAWLMQDAKASFSAYYRLEQELLEPCKFYNKEPISILKEKLYHFLDAFQLSPLLLCKKIAEVSGGEAERLALVRALLCKPSLLIMDEATSGLNDDLKEMIFCTLNNLVKETNLTLFIISHQEVRAFLGKTLCYSLDNGYLHRVK
jgi:ABC-type dipeptide/oligopeptide/nickel transport system ATPase subunit